MKHAREILFAALLTFLAPFVRAYEMRTWTAMNGKTTEAAFVKYESDTQKIVMQKRDGTIIKVHRDSLCDEDWVYVMKYDPSIFEIFVYLGQANVIVDEENPKISKPCQFYASNTKMVKIVRDGKFLAYIPLVRAIFPPHNDGSTIETGCIAKGHVHNMYYFGDVERNWTIDVAKGEDRTVTKLRHNGTQYKEILGRQVKINLASGQQYQWVRKNVSGPIIGLEEHEEKSKQLESLYQNKWITLFFDSMNTEAIEKLRHNAQILSHLLEANDRYERVSKLLASKNTGVPDVASIPSEKSKLLATGSGFFISSDGYFLTNYHVVKGSKNIRLRTVFGNALARVIRVDPDVDLALLKADKRGFVPLPFAAESSASLGEDIFTIGFPMPDLQGFSPKMTKGVISSLNGIQDDDVQYQIDASIQPGNSGGPLVNNQGELVGVVVATLKAGLVAEKKGVLPQNVNYAIKKKHVLDFLAQVPACLRSIQTSNQPATGKSATPETIEAVQNSCAMVIVFE